MQARDLLLVFFAALVLLLFGFVWIAEIVFLALLVFFLFYVLAKSASFGKESYKSLSKGVMTDLEKAKGQNPKGSAEFAGIFNALGNKTGEIVFAKPNQILKAPNIYDRLGTASKNLLDGLGKLFK